MIASRGPSSAPDTAEIVERAKLLLAYGHSPRCVPRQPSRSRLATGSARARQASEFQTCCASPRLNMPCGWQMLLQWARARADGRCAQPRKGASPCAHGAIRRNTNSGRNCPCTLCRPQLTSSPPDLVFLAIPLPPPTACLLPCSLATSFPVPPAPLRSTSCPPPPRSFRRRRSVTTTLTSWRWSASGGTAQGRAPEGVRAMRGSFGGRGREAKEHRQGAYEKRL